jgi:uroporphyrinogen decarboxylase
MSSHRQRVNAALAHREPDRVPRDFSAEPQVWEKLLAYFNTRSREDVLRKLDVDCRVVSYDFEVFCRPPHERQTAGSPLSAWRMDTCDGLRVDIWGAKRKISRSGQAVYEELCEYPLREADTIQELKGYQWPQPQWWDFTELSNVIEQVNPGAEYHLRFRMGSIFETAWSLCGFDRMLENLILRPELSCYMMDRITEVHIENLRRVMEMAGDKIDMLYSYDDLAGQNGLLLSPQLWNQTIKVRQEKLFNLARSYGKPLMYHCCGRIDPLIEQLIDIGVEVLNPLQPLALAADFAELKQRYGRQLTFHGGIDIQQLLPHGTCQQVKEEVERIKSVLGRDGGYILAPAHHIQADTSIENILAIYGL